MIKIRIADYTICKRIAFFALALCVWVAPVFALSSGKFTSLTATVGISATSFQASGTNAFTATGAGQTISATNGYFTYVSATNLSVGAGGSLGLNVSTTAAGGYVSSTNGYFANISATTGVAIRGFTISADTAISAGMSLNMAHGCGAVPRLAWAEIVNVTPEFGYTAGLTVPLTIASNATNAGMTIASDATSTTLRIGTAAGAPIIIVRLDTANTGGFTYANWNIHLKTGC